MLPRPGWCRLRGIPGEVTIGPCQVRGLLVRCAAHDGADSVRGLLLLRLPRAGTGPARDGLAPPLPPPPVHRPPPTQITKSARPVGEQGLRFEEFAARRPPKRITRRRSSMPPPGCWP